MSLKVYNILFILVLLDMKILADQYLYKLEKILPDDVHLVHFDPGEGFPEHAVDFDAILIRTVTKINRQTLPDFGNLKFVGSATAGFDHVDTGYLNQSGVMFANSAGCNSRAVAEFVITALYRWGEKKKKTPEDLTVGVIGCGNAGGALISLLEKLNIEFVMFDPPKEKRKKGFRSASLSELLKCDVLSFHTPLSENGEHATKHLCSSSWMNNKFRLIINTARGGVVDEKALRFAMNHGFVEDAILDVWENEPLFFDKMAEQAFIATPHIAGYSREAKWRASEMVVSRLCAHFGLDYQKPKKSDWFEEESLQITEGASFAQFMWENNQIDLYDRKLRKLIGISDHQKAEKFATLRSQTETRFEYRSIIQKAKETGKPIPEKTGIFLK